MRLSPNRIDGYQFHGVAWGGSQQREFQITSDFELLARYHFHGRLAPIRTVSRALSFRLGIKRLI